METFIQDLAFALRLMRKNPGFTFITVATLALGIGVNTAMFSIVHTVLLRPLPFPEPEQLVKVVFNNPGVGLRDVSFSAVEMDDLREKSGVFADVSVAWPVSGNVTGTAQPARLEFLGTSPGYFTLLGAKAQLGRIFGPEDEAAGFAGTLIISDALWHRSFGGTPDVLGKTMRIDNDPYVIVGVMPAGFRHPGRTLTRDVEAWATAGYKGDPFPKPTRGARGLPGMIGRLQPGLTLEQAQAKIDALTDALRRQYPEDYPANNRWSIELVPLQRSLVGDIRSMLFVLQGAVLLIVLIATVNIANLLVARASGRQREIAVRLALGAGRGRIMRQLFSEAVVLALCGGVAGVLAAAFTLRSIVRLVPANIPRLAEVGINPSLLGFALLLTLVIGAVLGFVLAFQFSKADIALAIREGAPGAGHGAKTSRLRNLLIVSELALAVVLMIGAGLLLRTFWNLLHENPGFNPDSVVAASMWLPVPNDPKTDVYGKLDYQVKFHREVLRRTAALPGVTAAGLTSALPASGVINTAALVIEGRPIDLATDLSTEVIRVSPGYFAAMQARLVRGRLFEETDETGKPDVGVIDRATARRFWGDADPVGRRLKTSASAGAPWITVVGVIEDMKLDGLDTSGVPHLYRPIFQAGTRTLNLVLRTTQPAAQLENAIVRETHAVDPAMPVFNVRSMDDILGVSLAPRRFSASLVGAFAFLALLLSSIGIYGLLAFMVNQRAREMGIRLALGAQRSDIFGLILGKGVVLAGVGVLCGLLLAAAVAPVMAVVLYGVHPYDPLVFITVPVLLFTVSLLASYVPAQRAAAGDPMLALRQV